MAESQILLVLCLGMLASFNGVIAGYTATIYFPNHIKPDIKDDIEFSTSNSFFTVSKESTKKLSIFPLSINLQSMLTKLETLVANNKIRVHISDGGSFDIYCTLNRVEFANRIKGVEHMNGYTADFKFTFSLDATNFKWQEFTVGICIPNNNAHYVDSGTLNRTMRTITVTKHAVSGLECTEGDLDVQSMLNSLKDVVTTGATKIEIPIGVEYNEFGTITSVEMINFRNERRETSGSTADFQFTYSLDVDSSQWSPCVFAGMYFGFRKSDKWEILLTTTEDVIEYLILTASTEWVFMCDVDTNGNKYKGNPDYLIFGLQTTSEKPVHGDIKTYILSYSAFEKLQPT